MAENLNLSLDFVGSQDSKNGSGRRPVARVRVDSACSYARETGAPVITADCASVEEFEAEVKRLREELDAIVREANARFSDEPAPARESPAPPPGETSKRQIAVPDGLRVRDQMTRDVETLGPNDKIRVADELMKVGNFRHVVVVDEEQSVVGVVSQRDICFSALAWAQGQGRTAHDRMLESLPVKEVMRSTVATIEPDASLVEAAQRMMADKIGCLPVVEKDRLVGILTAGDFLALLTDVELAETASTDSP